MSSVPQGTGSYPGAHTSFPDQSKFQKDPTNTNHPAQPAALGPGLIGETVFTSNPVLALAVQSWGLLFLGAGVDMYIYFQAGPGEGGRGGASELTRSPWAQCLAPSVGSTRQLQGEPSPQVYLLGDRIPLNSGSAVQSYGSGLLSSSPWGVSSLTALSLPLLPARSRKPASSLTLHFFIWLSLGYSLGLF